MELLNEHGVVALEVVHGCAHSRKAFAEAKIIRGVRLGWFALGPVPVSSILEIDDKDAMARDGLPLSLIHI